MKRILPIFASVLLACSSNNGGDDNTADGGGDGAMSGDSNMQNDSSSKDANQNDTGGNDSGNDSGGMDSGSDGGGGNNIKTIFLILMENHSWSTISGSSSAMYINKTMVPAGGYAQNYYTPKGIHPSEPNYVWLEAGNNLGITDDGEPSANHQATTDHLTTQLEKAGISWKAYVEDISGKNCPLASTGLFATKHTPQLFFDDVTGTNNANSQHCIDHIRPYTELKGDLMNNKVPQYVFITPNLCDDMHGEITGFTCNMFITDLIAKGDTWLSTNIPMIKGSSAYTNGGVIFVLWDEGDNSSDGPIGLIVNSPVAKTGYKNMVSYTHSSMLRTVEEVFGVPLLRDAKNATNLSDFFTAYP